MIQFILDHAPAFFIGLFYGTYGTLICLFFIGLAEHKRRQGQ